VLAPHNTHPKTVPVPAENKQDKLGTSVTLPT